MSIEENVQTVKDVFAAIGRGDEQGFRAPDDRCSTKTEQSGDCDRALRTELLRAVPKPFSRAPGSP